jgi:hypothetical protein
MMMETYSTEAEKTTASSYFCGLYVYFLVFNRCVIR